VTTPPVTTGGFSGHSRQRGSLRLTAPSGPADSLLRKRAGKDHSSGVHIGVGSFAAGGAAKAVGSSASRVHGVAGSAGARRARRIDSDHPPTSLFRFVGEERQELRPSCIGDLAVQSRLGPNVSTGLLDSPPRRAEHVAYPKLLDRDQIEARHQRMRELVGRVAPAVSLPLAVAGELRRCLRPATRAGLATRDSARRSANGRPHCPSGAWSTELVAGGERDQTADAEVDARHLAGRRAWSAVGKVHVEGDMPSATVGASSDFHLAEGGVVRNRPVPANLDAADSLEVKSTMLGDGNAAGVSLHGPGERAEAPIVLEAGVSGLFAAAQTAEKSSEGTIELAQDGLLGPEVSVVGEQAPRSQIGKLCRLSLVSDRLLAAPPCPAALLKRGVVEVTTGAELGVERLPLASGRIKAVAVDTLHEHMFAGEADGRR
jgi:hypothetical protein